MTTEQYSHGIDGRFNHINGCSESRKINSNKFFGKGITNFANDSIFCNIFRSLLSNNLRTKFAQKLTNKLRYVVLNNFLRCGKRLNIKLNWFDQL